MKTEAKETKDPVEPKFPWWKLNAIILLTLFFGLLILNVNWQFALELLKQPNLTDKFGQFGDIFGFSNAIFSGLAFILLAVGVWMQREELKDTKKLLSEQKKITEAQEAALQKQNEAIEKQIFENTFFKLIDMLNQKKENISASFNGNTFHGENALKKILNETRFQPSKLVNGYPQTVDINNYSPTKNELDDFRDCAFEIILINAGSYFTYLEEVFLYLYDFSIKNDIKLYANIINSYITKP